MKEDSIRKTSTLREALALIDQSGRGIAILIDDEGRIVRTVTDGDLRRLILNGANLDDNVSILPDGVPVIGAPETTRVEALAMMDDKQVDHLPIVDANGFVLDILDRRTLSKRIYLSSPHMGEYEKQFVEEAFESNWIAPIGPNVNAFEQELSAKLGINAAAAVSSGSAALHLALRILGVEQGDSVFCSTLTFVASANPILYQNAEPVFIDSEPDSWNMSPVALERALKDAKASNKLPKAIVVVNLYGQSADLDPIMDLAMAYGVPIVEDAAESLGAMYKGKPSGTFGTLGVFSFNGNKIITTSGGGMLVSDDTALIERARFLSTQAREPAVHYEHKEVGYNYRMSNILAGVGRGQLKVLDERVEARRRLYETYVRELADLPGLSWMPQPDWSRSNRWLSCCTIDPSATGIDHRKLIHDLSQEMIEARPIWKPLHLQPLFAGVNYYPHGNNSVADELFETGICLPSGSNMTASDISRVTDTIRSIIVGKHA